MKTNAFRLDPVVTLVLGMITIFFVGSTIAAAQCVDHPEGRTAVRFNNETRYDLTFFIDREQAGTFVPSRHVSEERAVPPGTHLLSAMAKIADKEHWVWVFNDIPSGQLCTWNVVDPPGLGKNWKGRGFDTPFVPF